MAGNDPPRSIFPQPAAFSLETFSSKDFIVKEFIEGLSNSCVPSTGRTGTGFDPKPYIRTFEAALRRLKELDLDLSEKESELKERVRRAENEHTKTIERLGDQFNKALANFQRLDSTISDGEGVAVRIGGQLEQLEKQRQRAADAVFLIQCYTEFSKGDTSRLERLRKTGRTDDSVKCAVVARQLSLITKRMEASGTGNTVNATNTRELVERFSESLEQDLLNQFDRAYKKQNSDWAVMKACAQVLTDFNGGDSVIQIFVNQHSFFIELDNLATGDIQQDSEVWERLPDPDVEPPAIEPSLDTFIREIRTTIIGESPVIARAFPYPDKVLGRFLQRLFQQSIQQKMEAVLQATSSVSGLAFLRALHAAKTSISSLVEEFKNHGLTEHPGPLSSATTLVLEQNLEELFHPYLAGTSYIEKEKNSLETLYSGLLLKFNLYHSRKKKYQGLGYIDRIKMATQKVSSEARDKAINKIMETDIGKSRSDVFARLMGVDGKDSKNDKNRLSDIETTDIDGQLSVDFAKRMLHWMAEAVGRSLELSPTSDTPKDVLVFLTTLLEHMRKIYLETALDAAIEAAEQSPKAEPDLAFFLEVKPATSIMHLMFIFINTALIPLASTSLTIRREMTIATNTSLTSLEGKVNVVIQKTIDLILAYVTTLLSRQKKQDFRPKDDDVSLTTLRTPTCTSVLLFLEKATTLTREAVDGSNLEFFLGELGGGFRTLILDHFKKYSVNAAGALMLTKDMTAYYDLVKSWNVGSLNESFEALREIANLFVVSPAALKDRLRDGVLVKVKPGLLKPYLMKREDYVSGGIEKILSATNE